MSIQKFRAFFSKRIIQLNMKFIWLFATLLSLSMLLFTSPQSVVSVMTGAMTTALQTCLSLAAVYCLWMGFLGVVKDCGLIDMLSAKMKPLTNKLFGKQSDETCKDLSLNVASNLLGAGNAATPPAVAAMRRMDDKSGKLTRGMAMLFVVNACGLQLIPTTVIGIRASLGSLNAADVVLPSLLTTLLSAAAGVFLTNLAFRGKK